MDATQKQTVIDQQKHSCETLICQRHKTILRLLSSVAIASTRWRVRELNCATTHTHTHTHARARTHTHRGQRNVSFCSDNSQRHFHPTLWEKVVRHLKNTNTEATGPTKAPTQLTCLLLYRRWAARPHLLCRWKLGTHKKKNSRKKKRCKDKVRKLEIQRGVHC